MSTSKDARLVFSNFRCFNLLSKSTSLSLQPRGESTILDGVGKVTIATETGTAKTKAHVYSLYSESQDSHSGDLPIGRPTLLEAAHLRQPGPTTPLLCRSCQSVPADRGSRGRRQGRRCKRARCLSRARTAVPTFVSRRMQPNMKTLLKSPDKASHT